jgi:hypothetical protein
VLEGDGLSGVVGGVEHGADQVPRGAGPEADVQRRPGVDLPGGRNRLLGAGQQVARRREEHLAGPGRADPAGRSLGPALDQPRADELLQVLDGLAECGLRDVQDRGGPGEAPGFDDGDEIPDQPQVQIRRSDGATSSSVTYRRTL